MRNPPADTGGVVTSTDGSARLARRLVERLGGRYSVALGIDIDRGGDEIERWALAATLYGARISTQTAERTYRTFVRAGLGSLADAGAKRFEELVELLDAGGYARYDFRTARRLQALARALEARHGGKIVDFGRIAEPAELEAALDALPGWGPVTVGLFLRELRGVWPAADPPVDARAQRAAEHLRLQRDSQSASPRDWLDQLARRARVDRRDLEASLVRLSLAHGRSASSCAGGERCVVLEPEPVTRGPAPSRSRAQRPTLRDIRAAADRLRPLHRPKRAPGPGDWLAVHREPGQTFAEFLAVRPARLTGRRTAIYVQPIGRFGSAQRQILELSSDALARFYGVRGEMLEAINADAVPARARRARPASGGEQILTRYVLDAILKPRRPKDALGVLALTTSDLWPGLGWNFVFGEADLAERVGVWSMYRYGDPEESEQAYRTCLRRTLKVALHETGHMLGMLHCTAYECGMNGSNHLVEMDARPMAFCPECAAKVWWVCGLEPAPWLESLAEFAQANMLAEEGSFWQRSRERLLSP
jgi:archaemetzincin